jgi:hypothetical protein
VVEALRAVDAVQDVPKRHKLGYALLIAMLVVVGSSMAIATIEEAHFFSRSRMAFGGR